MTFRGGTLARVNIETRAIAENRFFDFMQEMNFSRPMAIGVLTLFWHDSQELGIALGTKDQLLRCIPLKNSDREITLKALISCHYVDVVDAETFEIRGNQKHIDALLDKKIAGQKGGLAKAKNARKSNRSKQNVAPAKSALPNTIQCNAIQFNAMQSNSIQNNTKQNNSKKEKEESAEVENASRAATQLALIEKSKEEIHTPRLSKAHPRGVIVDFDSCDICRHRLEKVTHDLQHAWLKTYPGVEWVEQEIKRADVWIKSNPKKEPKEFGRFMSNWLSRSFESYRKGIPSRRMTQSEINAESLKEMARKNMAGEYD